MQLVLFLLIAIWEINKKNPKIMLIDPEIC